MNADSLRRALGDHLGHKLTPEICVAIEMAARKTVDEPIDLTLFHPRVLADGYVIAAEKFADCLEELKPLHERHWAETEQYRHGLALKPNYEGMLAFERAGQLLQITVRHQGKLVGGIRMFVTSSWHSENMVASEDTLFILPEHRNGASWLAMKLLRYTVSCLEVLRDARNEEVIEIDANSKLINRADVLMRRLFGDPVAMQFSKIFRRVSRPRVLAT